MLRDYHEISSPPNIKHGSALPHPTPLDLKLTTHFIESSLSLAKCLQMLRDYHEISSPPNLKHGSALPHPTPLVTYKAPIRLLEDTGLTTITSEGEG
ncbi:hypothetical protein M8J76_014174 [Diaphorina citri]|nr:hypothetical protein M8J75_006742 [Diaphorina citri]KAI5716892.1 hypothetical protein M8J76_014174 [Diaphorina citri]